MSEWITDRKPTDDAIVYGPDGKPAQYRSFSFGRIQPWKPIPHIEPYVKPKRYVIRCYGDFGLPGPAGYWCVYDIVRNVSVSDFMPREAAERIAAIYEEARP